jgi:GxxExxY protein
MVELADMGIAACRQVEILVEYRGNNLGIGFRADIIVDGCLLLEIKVMESIIGIHKAQIITYLKLLRLKRGYILNFNSPLIKTGIHRISI